MVEIIKEDQPANSAEEKPHVVFLLDESGSMQVHRKSVVDTFNEYVASVRDTAKAISLYTFDSEGIRMKMFNVPPKEVKRLTAEDYKPNAMTPLYDAAAKVITEFHPDMKVQFVLHTDGQENNSKEWTFKAVNALIKERTDAGWLFVYLGEGIEGKAELAKFDGGLKVNFSSSNRRGAMGQAVLATSAYSLYDKADPMAQRITRTVDIDKGETL
jgi:hypothetical protein